jgi:hypothetical protein
LKCNPETNPNDKKKVLFFIVEIKNTLDEKPVYNGTKQMEKKSDKICCVLEQKKKRNQEESHMIKTSL